MGPAQTTYSAPRIGARPAQRRSELHELAGQTLVLERGIERRHRPVRRGERNLESLVREVLDPGGGTANRIVGPAGGARHQSEPQVMGEDFHADRPAVPRCIAVRVLGRAERRARMRIRSEGVRRHQQTGERAQPGIRDSVQGERVTTVRQAVAEDVKVRVASRGCRGEDARQDEGKRRKRPPQRPHPQQGCPRFTVEVAHAPPERMSKSSSCLATCPAQFRPTNTTRGCKTAIPVLRRNLISLRDIL